MVYNAQPPRYVPTLTEVVVPPPVTVPEPDATTLAERVLQALMPQLEAHLRQSATALLELQLREVLPGLQAQIEATVRHAVEQALNDAAARDGNPVRKAT